MAEAHGADARLVAVMQYSRVVIVAAVASGVAAVFGGVAPGHAAGIVWFAPVHWGWLAATLALAVGSAVVAARLPIAAGALLVPLVLGVVLQDAFGMRIELPPMLLAVSYAMVGWSIGLRFTRPILVYTARVLPRMIASILVLVAICGAMGGVLVWLADVDPMTAYLATSPGGADSVAIIAASIKVDVPFVMAMQTARLVIVILIGPTVARIIARKITAQAPA
jgi:membrane AbrB-like protein